MAALPAIVALASAAYGANQQREAAFQSKLQADKQATLANIAGKNAQTEQNIEAAQLDASANADRAASQRDAADQLHKANLMKSRAMAVAAASGGSTLDPSVINIISGFDSEGQLAANTTLYNANEGAKQKEFSAVLKRNSGSDYAIAGANTADAYRTAGTLAQKTGNANANTTILNGVSSFAKSYVSDAPPKKEKDGIGETAYG